MVATFEVISPAPLSAGTVIAELEKVLVDEGKNAVKEFGKTVATWNPPKVKFAYKITHGPRDSTMFAYPDSGKVEVWKMLTLGIPPKQVPKSGDATMTFYPTGRYRKKTRVRQLRSYSGGPIGPKNTRITRRGSWMQYRGVKARQWGERYINLRSKVFSSNAIAAVEKGAQGFFP